MKPALTDLLASARVVSLPLRTKFRGVVDREVMLFEGPNGWSEWSPFLEYPDEEAAVWLSAAIEFAYGKTRALVRDRIAVNATLPAVSVDQVETVLARFGTFNTVKIKVAEPGQTPGQDVDRIVAVRKLYPDVKIRLDANGGWSPELSFSFIKALAGQGIQLEYLEQPCKTIDEMARLRQMIAESSFNVLIAADESVRKASDPMAVVEAEAADILVLKVAPLGGVSRALEIARGAGLPVVVSSALDSSVGISMGAHLAAALPDLSFDCGLGTASLLAGDVTRNPLLPVDGFIEVRRVEIDPQKLDIFEAEDHRIDWWIDRLDRAFKHLN
jgi:O-succinylbenzoate synthase